MALPKNFTVEVAFATPTRQKILKATVATGDTVYDAIMASGILNLFPEIDLSQQKVGIFSKICQLSDPITPLSRIEIYRPLTINPKEARRLKALRAKCAASHGLTVGPPWTSTKPKKPPK